jgi:hypothetical protein
MLRPLHSIRRTKDNGLSAMFTKQEFLDIIAAGPKKEYLHVTVLEGWSKYDIDAMLVEKGYINP